jgi:hypothetical protein
MEREGRGGAGQNRGAPAARSRGRGARGRGANNRGGGGGRGGAVQQYQPIASPLIIGGSDLPPGVDRAYWTDAFVTLSTLIRPRNRDEARDLQNKLADFIRDLRDNPLDKAIAFPSDTIWVELQRPWGVEVGARPRGGRVHAHFIFTAQHTGIWNAAEVSAGIAEWLKIRWPELRRGVSGVYCNLRILPSSYAKNYLEKNRHTPTKNPRPALQAKMDDLSGRAEQSMEAAGVNEPLPLVLI